MKLKMVGLGKMGFNLALNMKDHEVDVEGFDVNEEARKNTMAGLRSAEGFIRMQLAKKVNLRNTPEITFILDESVEYGVNMSKKIEEVMAEDEAKSKEHDSAE